MPSAWRDIGQVFGYMKNAALTAQGQSAEPMSGHINWARNRNPESVARHVEGYVATVRDTLGLTGVSSIYVTAPASETLTQAFGHVKNAWLRSRGGNTEA